MNKKTVLLTIQAVLCALTAAVLIGSDLSIYLTGLRARAESPMANIYTVEAITSKAVSRFPCSNSSNNYKCSARNTGR